MCGIVGMAGALEFKDKDVLNDMLFFCQLRGEDSTGIFHVPKDSDEASIIKTVGTPDYLFASTRYDRMSLYAQRVVIGHCRKATVGATTKHNAHPFNYGRMTGVHNGTLRNWRLLPGDSEAIDSQTLYENFDRVGVKPTIEAIDGAYALIWWDDQEGMLNVLRNKERPLYYAMSEDFKKILWASESWMISVAASRNGMKLADLTPKEAYTTHVASVDPDNWWQIKVGRRGAQHALTFRTAEDGYDGKLEGGTNKAVAAPVPFRPSHAYQARPNVPNPWRGLTDDLDDNLVDAATRDQASPNGPQTLGRMNSADASASTNSSSTNTSETDTTRNLPVIRDRKPTLTLVPTNKNSGSASCDSSGQLIGNNGLILDKQEFVELVDEECMWCKKRHSYEDLRDDGKLGAWIDDETFICSGCLTDDALKAAF